MDYGIERSEKYGHSRFGHTYKQGEVSFSSALTFLICFVAKVFLFLFVSM